MRRIFLILAVSAALLAALVFWPKDEPSVVYRQDPIVANDSTTAAALALFGASDRRPEAAPRGEDDPHFAEENWGAVKFFVRDASGTPIAGATVELAFGEHTATGESDEKGELTMKWGEPRAWYTARAPGYVGVEGSVEVPGELVIEMIPGGAIRGRVVDPQNRPLSGVEVFDWNASREKATTGALGEFLLENLEPGRHTLHAVHARWAGTTSAEIEVGPGETTDGVVIVAKGAFSAAAVVLVGKEERCRSGSARAWIERVGGPNRQAKIKDGELTLTGLLPGKYQAWIDCETYPRLRERFEIVDRDLTGLVWRLESGAALNVTVVGGDARPMEGVQIEGHSPENRFESRAVTGAAGSATLRGLLPGKYFVDAISRTDRVVSSSVVITNADVDLRIVFDESKGAQVSGTITGEDGRPVSDVSIELFSFSGAQRTIAEGGRFRLTGLSPGTYSFAARKLGTDYSPLEFVESPGFFKLADDETREVRLVVKRTDGVIRGRVLDASGAPITDAFVSASPDRSTDKIGSARWGRGNKKLTDLEGRFSLENLSAGTYTVVAHRPNGDEAIAEGVALGADLTLVLEPAGSISGTIRGFKVPPRASVSCEKRSLTRAISVDSSGKFTVSALPPCEYSIRASSEDQFGQVFVALGREEQKKGVVVELAPGGSVSGRILEYGSKQPLGGVLVFVSHRSDFGADTAVSGADGTFRIENVAAGEVSVRAGEDESFCGSSAAVRVASGRTTEAGNLVVRRRTPVLPNEAGRFGFSIASGGSGMPVMVRNVTHGSPAQRAGLVAGDEIIAIDGELVANDSDAFWCLVRVKRGSTLKFGLKRGPTLTITAE